MPTTLNDLLQRLTTDAVFLGLAASLITGWIIRAVQRLRPGTTIAGDAARWLALAVAVGLALLAYTGEAARGTVAWSVDGAYPIVLLAIAAAGGSQAVYSGYKALKAQVTDAATQPPA